MIRPDNKYLPRFIIESGWSESLNRLRNDMNLWLVRGNGEVKAVLILNWQRVGTSNRVAGNTEYYYTLDRNRREQTEYVVFPRSQRNQSLDLPRELLFGYGAPPRPSATYFCLDFDELREVMAETLNLMGLVPACSLVYLHCIGWSYWWVQ